jgi:hypothetical protein
MMRHGLVLAARFRRQNGPWRVPCGYALGGCHYDTNVNHDASPKRCYNRIIAAVGMLEIRKSGEEPFHVRVTRVAGVTSCVENKEFFHP